MGLFGGVVGRVLILACAASGVLGLAGPRAARAASDPGLLLELDRERYELAVRDLRSGESGPSLRVVLGSPAHSTPAGSYPVSRVILNPAWRPSDDALAAGAEALPPSLDGPMGVAKIPFADLGSVALHGGSSPAGQAGIRGLRARARRGPAARDRVAAPAGRVGAGRAPGRWRGAPLLPASGPHAGSLIHGSPRLTSLQLCGSRRRL